MADRYMSLEARFWAKVNVESGGCWEWLGGRTESDGYGRIRLDGVQLLAHRVSYEIHAGPIAGDLTIDHLCRNRWCVNPEHLEPVERGENARRYASSLDRCKHGHEFTPENTRNYQRAGAWRRACRACGRRRYYERKQRLANGSS